MKRNRFLMVTPDSVNDLLALQKAYSRIYIPYLRNLAARLSYSREAKSRVLDLLIKVQKVIRVIGLVTSGRATKQQVEDLMKMNKEVIKEIEFYQKEMQTDEDLARDVIASVREVGISLDTLQKVTELIEKRKPRVKPLREPRFAGLGRAGAEFGKAVLTPLLGPFTPIAELGWGMLRGLGRGILRTYRGARYTAKKIGGPSLEEVLMTAEEERSLSELLRPRPRGRKSAKQTMAERYEEIRRRTPEEWHAMGLPAPGPEFWWQSLGRKEKFTPIDEFFEKKAYRTKWTKEVLKSLKNIEKSSRGDRRSIGDMLKGLGRGLLSLGRFGLYGLGIVALAYGTKVLLEKTIGKVLDKWVEQAREAAQMAKKAAENTEVNRKRIAENIDKIGQKYKDERIRKLHQLRVAKAALPAGSPLEAELDAQIKALESDIAKQPSVPAPQVKVPSGSEMILGGERVRVMTPEAYQQFLDSVEKLNQNISELGNTIKDGQTKPETVPPESMDDLMHDIGDVLVDGLNLGGLEWGY